MLYLFDASARSAPVVVTLPVRAGSQVVDWTTTSRSEADRNLGRKVRKRGKRKRVKCRNCKGAGLARMPGATAVHRFFWLVLGDHILDQRKADAAGRQDARKERAA